jgi:hypothetical protein
MQRGGEGEHQAHVLPYTLRRVQHFTGMCSAESHMCVFGSVEVEGVSSRSCARMRQHFACT